MAGRVPTSGFDPHVAQWLNKFGFSTLPQHVPFDESHGYAANFCHVNAKHAAAKLGGKRVHGWAIWLFDNPTVAHAEFHSVVRTDEGLVDVTPPKFGAAKVLFIEDESLSIVSSGGNYVMHSDRSCSPLGEYWVGSQITGKTWLLPEANPSLVKYLASLGLKDML